MSAASATARSAGAVTTTSSSPFTSPRTASSSPSPVSPSKRSGPRRSRPPSSSAELVDAARRAREQGRLLASRGLGGDPLEGIPQHAVAAGDLVDGKVALVHAAVRSEQLYASFDPRPEGLGQFLRARRLGPLVEVEPAHRHAEAADLDGDVLALGELGHGLLPGRPHLVVAAGVAGIAQRATNVVEDDRGVGEGVGQLGDLSDLRMVEPGVEGQVALGELLEAFAPGLVAGQLGRRVGARIADAGIGIPAGLVADALEAAVA